MSLLLRIKRWQKRNGPRIEVWDTSAISSFLTTLMEKLQFEKNYKLIVPEGVMHELRSGFRNFEKCRLAYNFLLRQKEAMSPNVIFEPTPDEARSWSIDEQVVFTAKKYSIQGYRVKLITCDKDQSFRADIQGVRSYAIPMNSSAYKKTQLPIRNNNQDATNQTNQDSKIEIINEIEQKTEEIKESKINVEESGEDPETEKNLNVSFEEYVPKYLPQKLTFPCKKNKTETYLFLKRGMALFSSQGKRKIPKGPIAKFEASDFLTFYDIKYKISEINELSVIFERINE